MQTMITSSKPVNPHNSMQICLNDAKYYFQFGLLLFQDISDKVAADDDVTCMMMSSLICCVCYYL